MDWFLYDRDLRNERVNAEEYLGPCQLSTIKLFCENNQQVKASS